MPSLIDAAKAGDLGTVRQILADPGDSEDRGRALRLAAQEGRAEVAKALLEAKADVESRGNRRSTALGSAAYHGHAEAAKALLEARADLESKNSDGNTALALAVFYGHAEAAKALLDARADPESKGNDDFNALGRAAASGHAEVAKVLLDARADLESQNSTGFTALGRAAFNDHAVVAMVLLEARANLESKDNKGHTALALAAQEGHAEAAKALLEARADLEMKDNNGYTPLRLAAYYGYAEVAKALLEAQADLESTNDHGATALVLAADQGHADVAMALLEARADVESKSNEGGTALGSAAYNGHAAVAQALLEARADLESKNDYGDTALGLAASKGNAEVAKLLVDQMGATASEASLCQLVTAASPEIVEIFADMVQPAGGIEEACSDHVVSFLVHMPSTILTLTSNPIDGTRPSAVYGSPRDGCCRAIPIARAVLRKFPIDPCLIGDDLLHAFATSQNADMLKLSASRAIVEHAWSEVQLHAQVDILTNFVLTTVVCQASAAWRNEEGASTPSMIVLALGVSKRLVEEAVQAYKQCRRARPLSYLLNKETVIDWTFLTSNLAMLTLLPQQSDAPVHKLVLAACVVQIWLRLLYSMRVLDGFGPRFLPIFNAVQDTTAFFIVVACFLAAATHAYYIIGRRDEPWPFYEAFLQSFRLGVMGDFHLFEFEGLDTVYVENREGVWQPRDPYPSEDYVATHMIFYFSAVGISIILMNLFIGVLSQSYDIYADISMELFLRARARTAVNIRNRPWRTIFQWIWSRGRPLTPSPGSDKDEEEQKWLYYFEREDPSGEETRSMRSLLAKPNRALEALQKDMEQVKKDLKTQKDDFEEMKMLLRKLQGGGAPRGGEALTRASC